MLSLSNIFEKSSLMLSRVQLDSNGVTYSGPAMANWDPDEGFRLQGVLNQVAGVRPKTITCGHAIFSDKCEGAIRIAYGNFERAAFFHGGMDSYCFNLHTSNSLDVTLSGLVSVKQKKETMSQCGHMVYEGKLPIILPDMVTRKETIRDKVIREGFSRGMDYHENGFGFVIHNNDDDKYHLRWSIPPRIMNNKNCARYPYAVVQAWKFFSNSSAEPMYSNVHDGRRIIKYVQKRQKSIRLGRYELIPFGKAISGADLLKLSLFFHENGPRAHVARNIMLQCFEASRARTWHATMFLIGSVLEAAMRTIYSIPFEHSKRRRDFCMNSCLIDFKDTYLGGNWDSAIDNICKAYKCIRHRSAHPDWLKTGVGSLTKEMQAETHNDLILMSRFYGYMILAMAGFKNLNPDFPEPVAS